MSPSVDAGVSQAGGSLGTYTGLLAPTTPFHVVVAARRRFPSCVADPFFRKLGGSGFATRARQVLDVAPTNCAAAGWKSTKFVFDCVAD